MACPKGQYYCNTHKECRPIPDGCKVNKDGILVKEDLSKVVKGALTTAVQSGMKDLSKGELTGDRVGNTIKKHGKGALRSVVNSKTFKKFLEQTEVSEAKVDDVKYSKDEKLKDHSKDVHLLHANPGVRQDRNKRRNASDVVFRGHSTVERDRKQAHYASRGVKKEIAGKDHSIDLKQEETVLEWGWKDHNKAIEQRKIKNRKAVPYEALTAKKKSETVAASHELKGDNLQELDRGGGIAATAAIIGSGIGLAKSGYDAVSKTVKNLQKTTKQKNKQLRMEEMSDKDFKKLNKDMHDTAKAGGGASQEIQNKYALELARRRRNNNDGTVSTLTNKAMKEEVEGGVSVETYTNGIQFTEIETVDIIEPTRLTPSPKAADYYDWRVELDK